MTLLLIKQCLFGLSLVAGALLLLKCVPNVTWVNIKYKSVPRHFFSHLKAEILRLLLFQNGSPWLKIAANGQLCMMEAVRSIKSPGS